MSWYSDREYYREKLYETEKKLKTATEEEKQKLTKRIEQLENEIVQLESYGYEQEGD